MNLVSLSCISVLIQIKTHYYYYGVKNDPTPLLA